MITFDVHRSQHGFRRHATSGFRASISHERSRLESLEATFDRAVHARVQLLHGLYAIVDRADLPALRGRLWRPSAYGTRCEGKGGSMYAVSGLKPPDGYIAMHTLFVERSEPSAVIDHINRCGLDNRRHNLRVASKRLNAVNSSHRGCTYLRKSGKWQAQVTVDGEQRYLGLFTTEAEGRAAYRAILESRGELPQ